MKSSKFYKHFVVLAALVIMSGNGYAQIPAFPGAEGYAANITGGRGGVVFEVTTLEDDATNPPVGSLRAALKDTTTQPRTIVFRVGGVIDLKGRLDVGCSNVTIAGQTAPGDGICLKRYPMKVYGKNIIIRFLRFTIIFPSGDATFTGMDVFTLFRLVSNSFSSALSSFALAIIISPVAVIFGFEVMIERGTVKIAVAVVAIRIVTASMLALKANGFCRTFSKIKNSAVVIMAVAGASSWSP